MQGILQRQQTPSSTATSSDASILPVISQTSAVPFGSASATGATLLSPLQGAVCQSLNSKIINTNASTSHTALFSGALIQNCVFNINSFNKED
jgi:hypothetical protein